MGEIGRIAGRIIAAANGGEETGPRPAIDRQAAEIPSYQEALKEAARVGAAKSTGFALLAQTIKALSLAHAINPENTYKGAVKKGLTDDDVRRLARDPVKLGDLQFEV